MRVYSVLVGVLLTCGQWTPAQSTYRQSRPDKARHFPSHTVDIQDDAVLHVAAKHRRKKVLGTAPDIPALTDTTFPTTVYNVNNTLVVVLFYLPFDPVGMLFLHQYQQAGRMLATATASKGGHSSSPHPLTRVNCHDWTDVCRKENITTYPFIHLYQEGKWRQQYRDALDKDVLVRTVFLLQSGQPLWLRTEVEVKQFMDGHLPDNAHRLLDNLVLLKPSPSLSEMTVFTEVVRQLETQMLFAVVSPDLHTHLIRIEVGVLHVRLGDEHQPYDTLTQGLDTESIGHFLVTGKFQLLPELTYLNFPELSSRRHPLGVLFVRPSDSEASLHVHTVVDVIRSSHVHNVTFCTMRVEEDNPMAETLLRTYTGQLTLPAFVIVDFHQRTVFTFTKWALTDKKLIVWILGVQNGRIQPTSHLTKGEWKPSARHIDFLAKMDRDRERTEKKDNHHVTDVEEEDFPYHEGEDPPENPRHHQIHPIQNHPDKKPPPHQNQNQIPSRQNQNQNNRDQDKHPKNKEIQTQDKRNPNLQNQNQDTRHQNPNRHDHAQNQDKLSQNRHHNQDQTHRHRNQKPHNQNQNQQHKNQNQKQHRKDRNDDSRNINKNCRNPNQRSQREAPKLKQKTKMRLNVEDLDAKLDRQHKNHPVPPPPTRQEDSRTSSGGKNNLDPEGERDPEDPAMLRTEL